MERHIEMTARRMGLTVSSYDYDIENGVFVPKGVKYEKDPTGDAPAGK